jgi:negative regulator of flagellin synthesis FlgM
MSKVDGLNGLSGAAPAVATQAAPRRSAGKEAVSGPAEVSPVQLSQDALNLQGVQAAAASAPEVDNPRVEAIRAALAAGTYKVDAEAIASKLLSIEPHLPK